MASPKPPAPLLTTADVATLLSVHPKHVYRLMRQGLPARRVGATWRFERESDDDPLAKRGNARYVRQQALTLFMGAYEECRRGVSHLRWHEGDAASIVPLLYPRRGRGRVRQEDEVGENLVELGGIGAPEGDDPAETTADAAVAEAIASG